MQCPAQSGAVHPTVLTCFWLLGKDGTPGEAGLASPSPNLPQPAAEMAGDILTLRDQEEKEKGGLTASAVCPHFLPTPCPLVPLFSLDSSSCTSPHSSLLVIPLESLSFHLPHPYPLLCFFLPPFFFNWFTILYLFQVYDTVIKNFYRLYPF